MPMRGADLQAEGIGLEHPVHQNSDGVIAKQSPPKILHLSPS